MGKWANIITFENGNVIRLTEDEALSFIKAHGRKCRTNRKNSVSITTNDGKRVYFMGKKNKKKNRANRTNLAIVNCELDLTDLRSVDKEAAGIAELCFLSRTQLLRKMYDAIRYLYEKRGLAVKIDSDKYVFAEGDADVLLTAHVDTVHREQCSEKNTTYDAENRTLTSSVGIGGDDRCGVYIILKTIAELSEGDSSLPTIAICNYEETGADGSRALAKNEKAVAYIKEHCKYMIELDRAGTDEAVYYDCGNEAFKEYIDSKTKRSEHWGTFSDICELSPVTDVASVNLSCGYKDAHTKREVIVINEVIKCFEDVMLLISDLDNVSQFEYMEECSWGKYSGGFGKNYSNWNWCASGDEYWDEYYGNYSYSSSNKSSYVSEYFTGAYIQYTDDVLESRVYDETIDLTPYKIKDEECAEYVAIGKLIMGSRLNITKDGILGIEVY